MKRYEYQFGVFIDAENEQEAFRRLDKVMDLLSDLDAEGDPTMDGPWESEIPKD